MLKMIKLKTKNRKLEMFATHIPVIKRKTVIMVAYIILIRYRLLRYKIMIHS